MSNNSSGIAQLGKTVGAGIGGVVGSTYGKVGEIGGAVVGGAVGKVLVEYGESAVKNTRSEEDGMSTKPGASAFSFGESVQVLPVTGTAYIGKGMEVGMNASAFEHRNDYGDTLNVAKVGANWGVSNKGVNLGVDAKPLWAETSVGNARVGAGLSLDTGFQASDSGVAASFLGFGFKAGDNGSGIKTPFFNISW